MPKQEIANPTKVGVEHYLSMACGEWLTIKGTKDLEEVCLPSCPFVPLVVNDLAIMPREYAMQICRPHRGDSGLW
jgi:hypothetical protein